ncbi:MAG TPA: hypothetical protein VK184_27505 [Nostocaceae cyanobacterium]|nr:hypothetical protein [Nostocaceae cyanobacterium]
MKIPKICNLVLSIALLASPLIYQISKTSPATAETLEKNANSKFKTYTIKNAFAISYPTKWQVYRNDTYYIYITSQTPRYSEIWPDNFIKTDVSIQPESLETSLKNHLSNISEDKLLKREKIRINNREAYRISSTDGEVNTIVTFVKYPQNKTASIASFHAPSNSKILPTIYKIHNSFKVLR